MKPIMTKAEARAWKRRWRMVNELSIREARAATRKERLRDLDMLFRSRGMFRWPTDEEAGIPEARRRWLLLKLINRG